MGLARKILNVFCRDNNSDVGIFGSKYNGSPLSSTDPDSIQDLSNPASSWLSGWSKAIVSSQAPCMEDMNGAMYVLSYMAKYLYQTGIPEWNSSENYNLYALTQYGGKLYFCIQVDGNGNNLNKNPSSNPAWWRPIQLTALWVAGTTYSVGDTVNHNGRTYKCTSSHTASSLFTDDYYSGYWDDGNPAGTIIHDLSWNKGSLPYHYFDLTGADAGRELLISDYNELYNVIGIYYKNTNDYTTYPFTSYPDPASGYFRLPDLRNTFLKNSGSSPSGQGHNASHTHAHNRASTFSLAHDHILGGDTPMSSGGNIFVPIFANTTLDYNNWIWTTAANKGLVRGTTKTANLSIPPLNIKYQGSGDTPEPNFYGTKILLKY